MGVWDSFYEKARSFFSNDAGDTSATTTHQKKRCYYDLLEVDKDASEDEIKRSFKRLALRWHPDKNPDRLEECTAYFVLIQQAYEVLNDPQERAFYDRHRENIINIGDPNEKRDEGIILKPFMTTACFAGVFSMNSEEEKTQKFYTIYRDLFHKISAEEYAYIDDLEERSFPVFGKENSDFETIVAPFYAFWSNFSTRRSFAWLDKWDLRDAPDRQTTRAMEKDNKKLRELGRRERSEEIRKLTAFVRKHDKRVAQQKEFLRQKAEEQVRKTEEARRQAIRRNLENLDEFAQDEEEKRLHLLHLREIENALDAEFGTLVDEEDSDDDQSEGDYKCIPCEKSFKNSKSLSNHQKSKKHKQAVAELRKHMREEDQKLFTDNEENTENELSSSADDDDDETSQTHAKEAKKEKKRRKKAAKAATPAQENEAASVAVEAAPDLNLSDNQEPQHSKIKERSDQKPPRKKDRSWAHKKEMLKSQSKSKHQRHSSGSEAAADEKPTSKPTQPIVSECKTCGETFESRSKLFAHLKESGHASLKTVTEQPRQQPQPQHNSRSKKGKGNKTK